MPCHCSIRTDLREVQDDHTHDQPNNSDHFQEGMRKISKNPIEATLRNVASCSTRSEASPQKPMKSLKMKASKGSTITITQKSGRKAC